MIPDIESYYGRIAQAIVDAIPEAWINATIEVTFYPESSQYSAEYRRPDGKLRSVGLSMDGGRAFRELRKQFKEHGQRLWGQATFYIEPSGKFNMKWGYDNLDENGDTKFDGDEWLRKQEESRQRFNREG
jgi:hypothetical protein